VPGADGRQCWRNLARPALAAAAPPHNPAGDPAPPGQRTAAGVL